MATGGFVRGVGDIAGAIGQGAGDVGRGVGSVASTVGGGIGSGAKGLYNFATGSKGVNEAILGSPAVESSFNKFTPEQQESLNQILSQAMGQFQNAPKMDFGPIAERARKNFNERTVPTLAERFGNLGGARSSAFAQQMGQAGADLESQLAGLESQYGLESNKILQMLMSLGLSPQLENIYKPRQKGIIEGGATGAIAALPYVFAPHAALGAFMQGAKASGEDQQP